MESQWQGYTQNKLRIYLPHLSILTLTILIAIWMDTSIWSSPRSADTNWSISARDSGVSSIRMRIASNRDESIPVRYSCSPSLRANMVTTGQPSMQSYIMHESRYPGWLCRSLYIRHLFDASRFVHVSHALFTWLPVSLSTISYTLQQRPSHLSHIVSLEYDMDIQ